LLCSVDQYLPSTTTLITHFGKHIPAFQEFWISTASRSFTGFLSKHHPRYYFYEDHLTYPSPPTPTYPSSPRHSITYHRLPHSHHPSEQQHIRHLPHPPARTHTTRHTLAHTYTTHTCRPGSHSGTPNVFVIVVSFFKFSCW
jgi:hypothetical protein